MPPEWSSNWLRAGAGRPDFPIVAFRKSASIGLEEIFLRVVGLFAGIGGLELGLKSARHVMEAVAENDPFACNVLASRISDVPNLGNVTEVSSLPGCDLVVCGFPCQDLSQAGNGAGIHGAKSRLIREVHRLLDT